METISTPWSGVEPIHLQIQGNLKLSGTQQPVVEARSSSRNLVELIQEEDRILVKSKSNCTVLVPQEAPLILDEVNGNAQLDAILGDLKVQKIGGNLNLTDTGMVDIEKVYGNLTVLQANSDLQILSIYGNAKARQLEGTLRVQEAIKGNLILEGGRGARATALGNVTLSLNPPPGSIFEIKASGNIHCKLPENASTAVSIETSACNIRLDQPQDSRTLQQFKHELTLGSGEARIQLIAKGYVHLVTLPEDQPLFSFSQAAPGGDEVEVTEEISELIDEQMTALEKELSERLSHLPEHVDTSELSTDIDEIVEQARQYSTQAAIQAQARTEAASRRAQEKLAKKLEKARRKADRQARKAAWQASHAQRGPSPARPTPQADPVSDEEQLLILKMLQEGKISLEEADALLDALGGEGD